MRTFLGLLLTTTLTAAAAEPTATPPSAKQTIAFGISRAVNVEPKALEVLGTLCTQRYAVVSGAAVRAPDEVGRAIPEGGDLLAGAKALQASELVELSVVGLDRGPSGKRYLLDVLRRDVEGHELFRAELSADSLEDALPACDRLAQAVVSRTPVVDTLTRQNVTAWEARTSREKNRLGMERTLGFRTGFGGAVLASGAGPVNPVGSLTFDARLEREHYFIELGVGALFPAVLNTSVASYGGITTEVGASFYVMGGDTAAYLGAGVQPRIVFGGSIFNLAPYAQVGVVFGRQSTPRIYVEFRAAQNVLPVTYYWSNSGSGLLPTELSGQIGIGW